MKLFNTILSIYLLSIAILPCADDAEWCIFDIEDTFGVELHADADHEHEQECGDHCSPFCICSCCQMIIRPPVKPGLAIAVPELNYPTLVSLQITIPKRASIPDIWQPPRRV